MFIDATTFRTVKAYWLISVLSVTVLPLRAQSADHTLLLGDLYRDVRLANPQIAAAHALTRAAEARVPGSKVPPDPQLQLGFMNYSVPGLRPMDPLGMTQLQAMQMLPVAGKLTLAGRVSAGQARAQGERAEDLKWDVRSRTAMLFYDLYEAEQSVAIMRETMRLLQDLARTAEAMYRVGEGRQTDVLRAHVEIARMTQDTIRMRSMQRAVFARLNAMLDRVSDATLGAPSLPAFPESVPSLESLISIAERDRPMVKASEREVEVADAGARLAAREIWPDLTLGFQYGQRRVEMGVERMGSVMVGASVPIFASRRQLRMRDEANAMQVMSRADLAAMRADTRARVAEAYANLTRARSLIRLYQSTVLPQAEATVTSSLAAYRAGSVDFMTALDNRMKANEYRLELRTLEAEEGTAWAELEMLLGRELFDPFGTRRFANEEGGVR